MKKRIKLFALGTIGMLVLLCMVQIALAAGEGWLTRTHISKMSMSEIMHFAKRTIYAVYSLKESREDIGYLLANLEDILLMNPDPQSPDVKDPLGFFIMMLYPLYVLAIALTAFYLLLVSGTPPGRAKAKSLLVNFTAGMVVISLSPLIMEAVIGLSVKTTESILSQTDVEILTSNMAAVFGSSEWDSFCPLCIAHFFLTFVEVELGYYTFIPFFIVVWGALVVFIIRFLAVTLWIILFPVAVFLYSFDLTKDLGRNMLEQLILWTMLQAFNASIVVAAALCLIQKPVGFMSVSFQLPALPAEAGIGTEPTMVMLDFIPFMACILITLAPLFMLRLFRNFLP